jgi:uncharacterized protein YgfB (UPF0149 family)
LIDMQSDPDYLQLTERLTLSGLHPSASEAHGMLCGLICAGQREAERAWIDELLAGTDRRNVLVQELAGTLKGLAANTREEMDGPGLGLTPLLPGEERPLVERARGLYDWSRGFLFGLGVAGIGPADLAEPAREVFEDFSNITRMDLDALDEGEENEEALAELQEFIWVAAMLVYEECGRGEGGE